jgi:hypothetical protein
VVNTSQGLAEMVKTKTAQAIGVVQPEALAAGARLKEPDQSNLIDSFALLLLPPQSFEAP